MPKANLPLQNSHTLAQMLSRDYNVPTFGITCAVGSSLAQICDLTLALSTADDKSTVMTRSFTSMLLALQHLAASCAGGRTILDAIPAISVQLASQICN